VNLAGFRGHLVAASFLLAELTRDVEASDVASIRRRLVAALAALDRLGPTSSARRVLEILVTPMLAALDFEVIGEIQVVDDTAVVPAGSTAARFAREARAPIAVVVTAWGERLDRFWRTAVIEAQARDAEWSLLTNGAALRIIDGKRLYSRRYAEFELGAIVDEPLIAAAFRRLASADALTTAADQPRSLRAIVANSERYAAGVCRSLRGGVLAASKEVLAAAIGRRPTRSIPLDNAFEQSLTVVYRILFLLFAEARGLVPVWHRIYRDSYTIESLRQAAERAGPAVGLWDAFRAIGRLAHRGCRAGDLNVTPFNGRLFSPARTPLAERRGLDDLALRTAVIALSTRVSSDGGGRERIDYRELGVEQLGAVYETLLDYQPRLDSRVGRQRSAAGVTLIPGSGIRKSTGTFYTPQSIADYVVRRALSPLVRDATPAEILRLRVVDPSMGSGAFLVAACRFLSSAYEDALVRSGGCHESDLDDSGRTAIRRLVAEHCLYGVDVNPMAVQLARLSLWLATLAAQRPLSFLDHRLLTGDSLLGAWVGSLRRPPQFRRRLDSATLPLFDDEPATGALREGVPVRFSLESTPNDTLEQVRAKERALEVLSSRDHALPRWKRIADAWCATWFSGGPPATAFEALADRVLGRAGTLPAHTADEYVSAVDAIATANRFFHWELEFPEAFFDETGRRLARPGFDAVIGNPPWDMMRTDNPSAGSRKSIAPVASVVRFARDSGVYAAQSAGHANRYQLFVERAAALARPGGRVGLVLPSGFLADAGSAALRRLVFTTCDVDSVVAIDNRLRIFPIHRSVRFVVVTATAGAPTKRIACRFGLENVNELSVLDGDAASAFPIRITTETLERISGSSLGIPDLRRPIDLAIVEKAASLFAPLNHPSGWNVQFGRELNASEDKALFRADRRGVPVIDGKHLSPFRVAVDRSPRSIALADARRALGDRFGRRRLAYRDVASPTNRVTLIAALLPPDCVSTHTVFCLRTPMSLVDQHLLCGLFNSLVVNYLVRLRVSTHVTTAIVEQLPIPCRDAAPGACRRLAALARLLTRRFEEEQFARLNAEVGRLYRLTAEEFEHVLSTFPLIEPRIRDRARELFVGQVREEPRG
jgi:hypothetical protein